MQKLQEKKQAMEIEHAKRYSTLETEMQKVKSDHSSFVKDMENSRSAKVEANKRADETEDHALKTEERLKEVDNEVERRPEYFETMSMDAPEVADETTARETPVEEVVEGEVDAVDKEAIV
ncbi:hypothetical protein LIER_26717 [Lithospermum erythrorhizon]|uniref:Uncharacterized protein n=1 Tax=Lithospermum erythrorhizon TaxID=34254 RepID=A0AAV3RDF3_LITER